MSQIVRISQLNRFKAKSDAKYADKSALNALVGSDNGKTVRAIAAEELAAQLIPENAQDALDTLAKIAAWIQEHPGDASAMNAAITALQNKVDTGDSTVSAYVNAAIAALKIGDYATAANLTALANRVATLENTITGLGALSGKDTVTENDLSTALKEKVNAAAEGNHAHSNKSVLDGVTSDKVNAWDSKAEGNHTHTPASIGAAAASHTHDYAASGHTHAYADLTGKPTIPSTVAEMSDAADYAKKTDIPTLTFATDADIDALFE